MLQKKGSKERLFEVMSRVAPNFSSESATSNVEDSMVTEMPNGESEWNKDEFFNISAPVNSEDAQLFKTVINQGIDSHLEGFTKSKFEQKPGSTGTRLSMDFHKTELPLLLRRLEELGTDEAIGWAEDIRNHDTNIDEIANSITPGI